MFVSCFICYCFLPLRVLHTSQKSLGGPDNRIGCHTTKNSTSRDYELGATPGTILTKTPLLKNKTKQNTTAATTLPLDVLGPGSIQKLRHSCLQARHLYHHLCPQIHLPALSLCTRDSSSISWLCRFEWSGACNCAARQSGEMYYFCFCFGNVFQLGFSREAESMGYIRLAKKFVQVFWYHLMKTSK